MSKDLLEIHNVSKQIGVKQILKNVSLQANTGDLFVLTGPNGAGKTTLFRILARLLPETSGSILWNGESYDLNHGHLAYISHKPMLYENLSVWDNLEFYGKMYGNNKPDEIERLLKLVDLWYYRLEQVHILSRGMQQRLVLARSLLTKPRLILYDEPFTSLDSAGRDLLRSILNENKKNTIQLLITHEPQFLEGLAHSRVALKDGVLDQGGVIQHA